MTNTLTSLSPKTGQISVRDLIKSEYKKCAVDPEYFMRRYCYIQHMVRGRMLFNLYQYQADAVNTLQTEDRTIVLKARQLGFSTLVACYALWLTLFHRDKNVLIIATKQETAKNIVTKSRFAYDQLPPWLRSPVSENNKLNVRFKNGSQIKAVSSSTDAGRSEAVSLLIIDEAAFIDNAEEIWIAAQATLATGGKAILISTPNGVGNFFHKMWEKTVEEKADFYPIKLTWRSHPDRDEDWYQRELSVYGERGFRQEYEAEFLGSGNTVIDGELIAYYKETYEKEPVLKMGFDGNVWIWQEQQRGTPYVVCADVARGDGLDYSAFHVIDTVNVRQVAEYKGKIGTDEFGHMLVEVATKYNDALLVIENANNGWATIQTVIKRQYKNLFYMSDNPLYVEENSFVTNKWSQHDKKRLPGFTTSPKTRPLIISKLEEYMRGKNVIIHSARTLNEMLTFIWNNGKAEAQEGYSDDLVMALSIGLWIRDTSMKIYQNQIEMQKKAMENFTKTGIDAIYTSNNQMPDPYKMTVGGNLNPYNVGEMEDFRWLLGSSRR